MPIFAYLCDIDLEYLIISRHDQDELFLPNLATSFISHFMLLSSLSAQVAKTQCAAFLLADG